ncbi:N-acetyltransferase family 8 member 3 [Cololabis saira]|uniref:N-acetyltransferase family 8 member 3 n=1 Tax=Cololabis saira TaxID=129043 RepID=UPI002AD22A76|nr:N-acetyltransferase family 8 member 3 [Cololabis saira]
MAHKNDVQFSIREYRPSDEHVVLSLFRDGILEHVYPAFFSAMSNPDHIGVTLSISMAGYVLGGSSYFLALFFGLSWAGIIYYCCYEIYEDYMMKRLSTDMADIKASYLDNPDHGFWVAEADVNGQAKVVGILAVMGKAGEDEGERFEDWNGGLNGSEFDQDAGNGSYGEMSHLVVVYPWRRKTLGSQLMRKVLDFCKERGLTRIVTDVSSPQAAALSMYQKLGFVETASHRNTHRNRWFSKLARINMMRMEKSI